MLSYLVPLAADVSVYSYCLCFCVWYYGPAVTIAQFQKAIVRLECATAIDCSAQVSRG